MSLGVTNNCNLRCGYCVFGGKYDYMRVHSSAKMKYMTYKKSIDFFFNTYRSPFRVNRKPVNINFFGGEPLLEIENILKAGKYARGLYSNLSYKTGLNLKLSTNGVQLNLDNVQKLVDSDFDVDISLDGPKEQHDLFRKRINGEGSFNEIKKNIEKIQVRFPNYFGKKIRYKVTIHPEHDLVAFEEFFLRNQRYFNESNVSLIRLNTIGLDQAVYNKIRKGYAKQIVQIEQNLDQDQWFYKKLVSSRFENLLENPSKTIVTESNFTASCRPADSRIFVDTNGEIHICEKLNPYLPIGNVFDGFDFHAIKKILESWRIETLRRKCWECDPWWICNQCFASCATSDGVQISDKACFDQTEGSKKSIARFIASLERDYEQKKGAMNLDSIKNYLELL